MADDSALSADYVIIGAGSAGCVLADRLSEDGASVLLLEAGPRDWHPMIHVPAGALKLRADPLVNWNYYAAPEAGTGNRAFHWPRGLRLAREIGRFFADGRGALTSGATSATVFARSREDAARALGAVAA